MPRQSSARSCRARTAAPSWRCPRSTPRGWCSRHPRRRTGVSDVRIGMLVARVRVEEKLLLRAFDERGVDVDLVDVRRLVVDVAGWSPPWDLVIDPSLHPSWAFRGLRLPPDAGP